MDEKKGAEAARAKTTLQPSLKTSKPAAKKKKVNGAAIACALIIILFAGAVAAVYFDLGGAKSMAVSMLKLEAASTAEADAQIAKQQAALDDRAAQLEQQSKDLSAKDSSLKEKERQLEAQEKDIEVREDAVSSAEDEAVKAKDHEEYLVNMAQIFEQMDAEKAADAIAALGSYQDMADVIIRMSEEKAAAIMDNMPQKSATKILAAKMQ